MTKKQVVISVIAAVVVVAAAVTLIVFRNTLSGSGSTTAAPTTTLVSTSPPTPATTPALIVKIDNVAEARPQTGIGNADVIYVEPVEGGLTRLAAVYFTTKPPIIGPVRSARESDIDLLAQYGKPTLAYSGAAPELLPLLHAASLTNASPQEVGSAFFRNDAKPAPHNLYVRPDQLPVGQAPTRPVFSFGAAPQGGTPTTDYEANYLAARYSFHWDAAGHWLVKLDGTPVSPTDSGAVTPTTVIVQTVQISQGHDIEDVAGSPSPVAQTVGSGQVTVLRDGVSYPGTWSRPTASDPTTFSTADGQALTLAKGQAWILLKPA